MFKADGRRALLRWDAAARRGRSCHAH